MTRPKNIVEVISTLEKEYCMECEGPCIECPLLGPLKVLEEWQEKNEGQTDTSEGLGRFDGPLGNRVRPMTPRWAGGDKG